MIERAVVVGSGPVGLVISSILSEVVNNVTILLRDKGAAERNLSGVVRVTGEYDVDTSAVKYSYSAEAVVPTADLLIVTTSANFHVDIIERIAPYLSEKTELLLIPGRTYGALQVSRCLEKFRPELRLPIVEFQTTPFSCRMGGGNVNVLSKKQNVGYSILGNNTYGALRFEDIFLSLFHLKREDSTLATSLNSVGAMLHVPTIILNSGVISRGINLSEHTKFYTEHISPAVANMINLVDLERVTIGEALGKSNVIQSVLEWGERTYAIKSSNLYDALQKNPAYGTILAPISLNHRYLTEDVPTGLVPLESTAKLLKIKTPMISSLIDISNGLLNTNFRHTGRTLKNLEIDDCTQLLSV